MTFHPFHTPRPLWILCLACAALCPVSGAPKGLDEAAKALDEGVPEVALVKLEAQLSGPLDPVPRRQAKTLRAEALLAAGRIDEALEAMRDPEIKAPLLEARVEAASGDWSQALSLYAALPGDPKGVMGQAECLRALGRLPEAIAVLEPLAPKSPARVSLRLGEFYLEANELGKCARLLLGIHPPLSEPDRKWKQYEEARLLLAQNNPAPAYERFEALQNDPRHLTEEMMLGATLGMAQARTELSGLTVADDILEQFIWKHPQNPYLATLFLKLDEIYSGEENPSLNELQKMAQREPALRAGFATFYLAKREAWDNKCDLALAVLENFQTRFPQHPLLTQALLLQGQLLGGAGKFAEAQKALDEAMRSTHDGTQLAQIEIATAAAHFKAGEFVLAATIFRSAADRYPAIAETARFHAALAWLHQGNYARFESDHREFCTLFPQSARRGDLMLEEGLLKARQSDPKAEAALDQFLREFPGNPRAPEARLALAELRYANGDAAGANQYLRVVNESAAPAQTVEQADYLAIFVADSTTPPADDRVIALCRAFIEHYPTPSKSDDKLAEVRMKLGQVYFRKGDFASAQTQLETLARETPASPLVETALFIAGQASMKRIDDGGIDRAIELFSQVAALNGPLKFHARLELALLQNRLGKEADAVKLYDDILRANPVGGIKSAAMAGKADNLLALGAKDKAQYGAALAVYEALAQEPGLSATLQHRALYNKGRCLEMLGRPEEALAAYYEVVESGLTKPQEYFWFYKAGFDACRLSESREQWKSAIAIYQKMASIEGPRAEQAKARMDQLRLEHFIWE
jgi:outer membrane protein assembly factor BamD (BamD/ComL family)